MADAAGDAFPVLVTGIGGGGHGEQILKALRLGALGYQITGTNLDLRCANRGRVDHFAQLPPGGDPGYAAAVADLARERACVAIFHGSEPEMMALSKAREDLESQGFYVPVNPPRVLDICQDKVKTFRHLEHQGFSVPAFREVACLEDAADFDAFPAIVKPAAGGGGSVNTFIAQKRSELEAVTRYLLGYHDRFIAQEYVGMPDMEYTVGILFGSDGKLINSIAIRRIINTALTVRQRVANHTGRSELGEMLVVSSGVSQGQVIDCPDVRRQCEAIAASLEPRAPINVQCRLVGDTAIPFEINPRFSGTTSLRAMVGYNEPETLIRRDVLGEEINDEFPYREGMILRSLQETLIDDLPISDAKGE